MLRYKMRKRKFVESLPVERIPHAERLPGERFTVKHGIRLAHFGFEWDSVWHPPYEELPKGLKLPRNFPRDGVHRLHWWRHHWMLELVKPDTDFVFVQTWAQPARLMRLLEKRDHRPVELVRLGRFHMCTSGTNRVIAAHLEGRRVLARCLNLRSWG